MKSQRGVFLVFMSVLLIALISLGALSLDLGRLYILRSEMQNAVDSAALAGAMELQGSSGSRARAESVARYTLQHNSRFALMPNLLENIRFEFYCAIGSRFDPEPAEITSFCTNDYDSEGRSVATTDAEARYVRGIMEPGGDNLAYSIQFFFLPVLDPLLGPEETRGSLAAEATAGRNFYMCNTPLMLFYNPYEAQGQLDFSQGAEIGQQFVLRQRGSTLHTGDFGFVQPPDSHGAPGASRYLADDNLSGCTSALIGESATGQMNRRTANAMNTRFGRYQNPLPDHNGDSAWRWPPAPNVSNYPCDSNLCFEGAGRVGNGNWDRNAYWEQHHGHRGPPQAFFGTTEWNTLTRWELYNWELDNNMVPAAGIPTVAQNHDDDSRPRSVAERRLLYVAVLNRSVRPSGSSRFPLIPPEGFAIMFITERVGPADNPDILVEYVGWADASDSRYFVDIQLYE